MLMQVGRAGSPRIRRRHILMELVTLLLRRKEKVNSSKNINSFQKRSWTKMENAAHIAQRHQLVSSGCVTLLGIPIGAD